MGDSPRRWRAILERMFARATVPRVDPAEGPVPALAWPPSLVDRPRVPLLIYLDLNHWIGLAQAATGLPTGERHAAALEACRRARSEGVALFPLADAHYVETSKIKSPQQRQDLAAIMEELSGFVTLLSRPDVMRLELDAALARLLSSNETFLPALPLLGSGVFWAFGRVGLRIREGSEDITDRCRAENPELFDHMFRYSERQFLAGPADDQVLEMRSRGWRPDAAFEVAESRALEEQDQVVRFNADDRWRRGRIRDVILARELVIELFDMLNEALAVRSLQRSLLDGDRGRARSLVRSMPSSEVSTELKVAAHRNAQTNWTPNDIIDIDAMSLSVPYCDVVVTEKRACHTLRSAKLDVRMNTVILDRLADLPAALVSAREQAG
jgi:hypothetical protein